jgi:dihydroorotate dehydrogenase (fumarate)
MTASALLRHGPEHAAVLLDGLCEGCDAKDIPPSKNCAGCSPHPSAAAPTLVDLSKDAELVVTGCRGSGW